MTNLGIAVAWLIVQVTVVAAAALLLDAVIARRAPAAPPRLLGLAAALLLPLTFAAFVPAPHWWSWRDAAPLPVVSTAPTSDPEATAGESSPLVSFSPLAGFYSIKSYDSPVPSRVWAVLGGVYLAGVVVFLGAFVLGWVQLAMVRRRSRPLLDPTLHHLADTIGSQIGVRRVALREADLPGLPATVGWFRPVILLPTDWPQWPTDDRVAVLAHELAHVCNRDFLTGFVTQLSLALHFYHPLLRRLAARVRLRQELAADALAAAVAGGRGPYLRSLARMALRPQPRRPDGPARFLLSATGSALFRRIAMLRVTDDVRTASKFTRRLALAALLVAAVAASALRTPAEPPPAAPAENSKVEPFDTRYIGADAKAVVGIRPSVLIAGSKSDALKKLCREGLPTVAAMYGGKVPVGLSLEDIDQIVADAVITTQGTGEPNSRSLQVGTGCCLIRLSKDADWAKVLTEMYPKLKLAEATVAGKKCLLAEKDKSPFRLCFHAVDARTLLIATDEARLTATLKQGPVPRDWGTGWKQVERAALALTIDVRDGDYVKRFGKDVEDQPHLKALLGCPARYAVGLDFGDKTVERLFIDFADEATARRAVEAASAFRTDALDKLEKEKDAKTDTDALMVRDLLRSGVPQRDGMQVRATGTSSRGLAEMLPLKATVSQTEDNK